VVGALLDGVHNAGDPALDIGKRASRDNALAIGGVRGAAQLGIELLDERLDELGRHRPLLEPAQHPRSDLVPTDYQAICARPLGSTRRAAVTVGANNRVAATAASTPEQAAEALLEQLRAMGMAP